MTEVMRATYQEEDVRQTLQLMAPAGQITEIRIIGYNGSNQAVWGGLFDNHESIISELEKHADNGHAFYINVNPVLSDKINSNLNKIIRYKSGGGINTNAIERRQFFLIDFDPVRTAAIPSTDAEKDIAAETMEQVYSHLKTKGWPDPVKASSGNGYHLLYRMSKNMNLNPILIT